MSTHPTLETKRLRLRPYSEADIAELLPLIGTREVAATTLRIAHPYTEQDARAFLEMIQDANRIWLAIVLRDDGRQIGGAGLTVDQRHQHAELGYWLGAPYWGQGYATEAARELLRYGFEDLGLHRIFASHFGHNPASGRILAKLGMQYEGCQREHLLKWDKFVDSELYGILRQEWKIRQ
ncbi:MAG TPA: GNAT family protein [Candidatus Sulfotelmatobacter sp.]|nr:GNAT family protein [Candidatus Sulfotelmatobacter sp.]